MSFSEDYNEYNEYIISNRASVAAKLWRWREEVLELSELVCNLIMVITACIGVLKLTEMYANSQFFSLYFESS